MLTKCQQVVIMERRGKKGRTAVTLSNFLQRKLRSFYSKTNQPSHTPVILEFFLDQ